MIKKCPCCGEPLQSQGALEDGDWRLLPQSVELDGRMLKLTAAETSVLYALAEAGGAVMPPHAIGQRFARSGKASSSVRVIVARLRKKIGDRCPIETVHGRGYRWGHPRSEGGRNLPN